MSQVSKVAVQFAKTELLQFVQLGRSWSSAKDEPAPVMCQLGFTV
jgi:hypothetical protein